MIENKISILEANDKSDLFYLKWKKDAVQSVFIATPVAIVVCLVCFILIVGISIKLVFILLLPVAAIISGLVYSPIFLRRKYINGMVKKVHVEDNVIQIETYGWFNYQPIVGSFIKTDLQISHHLDNPFFKEKPLWILNIKYIKEIELYLVEDFFDDPIKLLVSEIK
ncbi:hypothetical protein HDC90_004469 [Pedobacter sp. AK013]|uniref:hypothetical protein n=1 Tax=Pedobacter sp. AK013 TaxID=2723071 RepID=UPI0016106894|nr:hypothetical protein [Pedobacter sp. AK013]MBB6239807.1 hypothetical protein [Pedobacter sp. AK013]